MSTHTIEITDDFLSQEDHKIIHDGMMNMGFAWEYSNNKVYELPHDAGLRDHQLVHMFFSRTGAMSSNIKLINPIMMKLEVLAVHRIKANLELYTGDTAHESDFHVDWKNPHTQEGCKNMTVGIYYVNTNNGYTEFEDGSKVESVANRFVSFTGDLIHRGVSQTDTKERVVINLNYFCDS